MNSLLNIADLRRSLLDYLDPDTITQLTEYELIYGTDKIDQDVDYWIKRVHRQYNIPKEEYLKLLHCSPEEREAAEDAVGFDLGDTPFAIFLFLEPRPSIGSGKMTLPGCDVDNDEYQLLSEKDKLKYPLAKYNFVPKKQCSYVFRRAPRTGQRCKNPAYKDFEYCTSCKRYPGVSWGPPGF